MVYFQNVVAVDAVGFHAVRRSFDQKGVKVELFPGRSAQAPLVVLHDKKNGKLPYRGHIQCLVKIAFRRTPVARKNQGQFLLSAQFVGQGNAVSHTQLGSQMGNHAHDMVFFAAKVKRTVSAFGETGHFSLKLRKKSKKGHFASGENPQVPVHG